MNPLATVGPCLSPLEEAVFADAYSKTAPDLRAFIKNTLALGHAFYGEQPQSSCTHLRKPALGFACTRHSQAVDWALFALDAGFASAPRLAAALMCARLAGVETLLPVWFGATQFPSALVCTLELTGVNTAYHSPQGSLADCVAEYTRQSPHGRILRFGASWAKQPLPAALPTWDDVPPRIAYNPQQLAPNAALSVLAWAHPDAAIQAVPEIPSAGLFDAVYGFTPPQEPCAPLLLDAAMAGCWLHHSLEPQFFMRHSLAARAELAD